jgi:hypothetical protein
MLDLESLWRFDQSSGSPRTAIEPSFIEQWFFGDMPQCCNVSYTHNQSQALPERGLTSAPNCKSRFAYEETLASRDSSSSRRTADTLKHASSHDSLKPQSRPCPDTALLTLARRSNSTASESQIITAHRAVTELFEKLPSSESCSEARPTPGVVITILPANHRTGTDGKGPELVRVMSHRTYQTYSLAKAQKQELIMQLSERLVQVTSQYGQALKNAKDAARRANKDKMREAVNAKNDIMQESKRLRTKLQGARREYSNISDLIAEYQSRHWESCAE